MSSIAAKELGKAYLIHRPALDYEESLDPLMIVIGKEKAERIAEEMREWCREKAKYVGLFPVEDAAYEKYLKRRVSVSREIPPYGLIELQWMAFEDVSTNWDTDGNKFAAFDDEAISVMELPADLTEALAQWRNEDE